MEDLGKISVTVLKKINVILYNIYYLIFCDVFIFIFIFIHTHITLFLFATFSLIVLVFKLIACPTNFAFFAVFAL